MGEAELVLVPVDGLFDVPNRTRDLPNRAEHERCRHVCLPLAECAVFRSAAPMPEPRAPLEPELGHDVFDVILDGVQADPEARRDLTIAETVADEMHDAPLRGREHVRVRRSSASSQRAHGSSLAKTGAIFPP